MADKPDLLLIGSCHMGLLAGSFRKKGVSCVGGAFWEIDPEIAEGKLSVQKDRLILATDPIIATRWDYTLTALHDMGVDVRSLPLVTNIGADIAGLFSPGNQAVEAGEEGFATAVAAAETLISGKYRKLLEFLREIVAIVPAVYWIANPPLEENGHDFWYSMGRFVSGMIASTGCVPIDLRPPPGGADGPHRNFSRKARSKVHASSTYYDTLAETLLGRFSSTALIEEDDPETADSSAEDRSTLRDDVDSEDSCEKIIREQWALQDRETVDPLTPQLLAVGSSNLALLVEALVKKGLRCIGGGINTGPDFDSMQWEPDDENILVPRETQIRNRWLGIVARLKAFGLTPYSLPVVTNLGAYRYLFPGERSLFERFSEYQQNKRQNKATVYPPLLEAEYDENEITEFLRTFYEKHLAFLLGLARRSPIVYWVSDPPSELEHRVFYGLVDTCLSRLYEQAGCVPLNVRKALDCFEDMPSRFVDVPGALHGSDEYFSDVATEFISLYERTNEGKVSVSVSGPLLGRGSTVLLLGNHQMQLLCDALKRRSVTCFGGHVLSGSAYDELQWDWSDETLISARDAQEQERWESLLSEIKESGNNVFSLPIITNIGAGLSDMVPSFIRHINASPVNGTISYNLGAVYNFVSITRRPQLEILRQLVGKSKRVLWVMDPPFQRDNITFYSYVENAMTALCRQIGCGVINMREDSGEHQKYMLDTDNKFSGSDLYYDRVAEKITSLPDSVLFSSTLAYNDLFL
ncbi:MAG: hypothetical protein ABT940_04830 [Alphaproteobacteria bacterium]